MISCVFLAQTKQINLEKENPLWIFGLAQTKQLIIGFVVKRFYLN